MGYRIESQLNIFDWVWQRTIHPEHGLVKLAHRIDWDNITYRLRKFYSKRGRHAKNIRLMIGLHILKHRDNLSDHEVVNKLHENIYYLHFCGIPVSKAFSVSKDCKKVLDESTMTKFRNRIGAEGIQVVESIVREQLVKEKRISCRTHIIDSTAMEKHIEYPTDSSLLHKGKKRLLGTIRKFHRCGVAIPNGLRSFSRVSKKVFLSVSKFGKGREERIKTGTKKLTSYARHVVKKVPNIVAEAQRKVRRLRQSGEQKMAQALQKTISELITTTDVVKKVIYQSVQRFKGIHVLNKIYSIHEPEVTCIRKGKRAKPNEYGSKVRISIDRNGFVVSHKEYHENLSDTETIKDACNDWKEACKTPALELAADRGFHMRKEDYPEEIFTVKKLSIPAKGKSPPPSESAYWFKRLQRRRTTIEPLISHLKQDHRMNRCRYRGFRGDQINVSLAVIAWNTKKWLSPPGI